MGKKKFFSLWHANLRVALRHILKPLNRPSLLLSGHPIISAELATPEPAMVLIKEECVGLAGNKLKGKKGGWQKWEGEEEEMNTEKMD